jgi:pimeloyl-ACP methyl ester carboxylesterase
VISWKRYVDAVENIYVAQSAALKYSAEPSVGLDVLKPNQDPNDLAKLLSVLETSISRPDEYFRPDASVEFSYNRQVLEFKSPFATTAENDAVRARLMEARGGERAVVLLHHWNADAEAYRTLALLIAASGISCLRLSLPYHHHRQTPGVGFARELVCENLGLTIRSHRQAVVECRLCLTWLERQGFRRLGIVGVSVGSSIASIVAALDSRVSAAALILMADDFAEVVWTGSATTHVKASLLRRFTFEEVQAAWAIVSPATYAKRLSERLDHVLIISGRRDMVFVPASTRRYVERLSASGLSPKWVQLGCGHYTLRLFPYSAITAARTITFLRGAL